MPYQTRPASFSRVGMITVIALIAALLISVLGTASQASAAPVEAGYKDHVYGSGVTDPTEDKPQSKVWFADGSWWAGMFVDGPDEYRIHKYNATAKTWADTGVPVDVRNSSHGDYLWDGATNSLYVASVNGDSGPDPIYVFKLNYNPSTDTYAHDPAFTAAGVQVGMGPAETVTIAKDSTGQLWVTYQNAVDPAVVEGPRNIMVNRSTTAQSVWGDPFVLDVTREDDISAIVAFGGNSIGVMWSDHDSTNPIGQGSFFYFATHTDSNTDDEAFAQTTAFSETDGDATEDHINLKLVGTSSGQVLAAVKTNAGPDHIQVLSRTGAGPWERHVVVSGEEPTRPQIVVDETAATAYVFYTNPESAGDPDADQAIYYKSAPLSTLDFTEAGVGTPFIQDGSNDINNISTAKHNVTSATGLVAIASSDSNNTYYHGYLSLGGASHPFTDIDGHPFEDEIVWLYDEGITKGCSPTTFCPDQSVIRGQMASFLVRALDLPSTDEDFFSDDEDSTYEKDINALADSGITKGCSPTTFCPNAPVTRQEMASFLVRAFDLPPTDEDFFTDDTGSTHEKDINALAASGITTGCSPTTFCPLQAVTRGQMAAFLFRAID